MAKTEQIKMSLLETNNGQIAGLPKNPRFIRDGRFGKLKESIKENPEMLELRELLVYPKDGKYVIIGGNMRYRACKELGYKSLPCKVLSAETTVEQLKAYTIKDNAGFGEWDLDMLANEWDEALLNACCLDIDFSEKQNADVDPHEDDYVEPNKLDIVVKRGDIWQLGEHRLMCGDSTSLTDVSILMDGEKADLCLTDPPFGNDLGYGRGQLGERRIKNDEDTTVLNNFFPSVDFALKKDTHALVWIQWRTFSDLEKAFEKYKLRTVVIWDKMQAGLGGGGFAEQYEMMCVFVKGHAVQNEYCGNVWQFQRIHAKREEMEHPHKKPVELLGKAINLCSKKGDVVVDFFGGSGSTLIACEQLGRKARLMELDEYYCAVIIDRWQKETGKEAVKL